MQEQLSSKIAYFADYFLKEDRQEKATNMIWKLTLILELQI